MNEMQLFQNPEFGKIRAVELDGEPWLVGKDVASALGYAKPENALAAHVDDEDKTTTLIQGSGSNYKSKAIVINESGLYSLVLSSKLPTAKKFKHWVTSEILPSVRKHGAYMTKQTLRETLKRPESVIEILEALRDEQEAREGLERKIESQKPKVLFADAVSASEQSILIGQLAKLLRQNGVPMGEKRLFQWMRENGYLGKNGNRYNIPTQMSMEMGLFEIKETAVTHSDGRVTVSTTAKVTGKGQVYFVNKFLNKDAEKKDAAAGEK